MMMDAGTQASPAHGRVQPPRRPAPDPGDLSRRLAARRAQLRLTVTQVAARAQVTQRYLEFLENFPAQPGPATLRRLAAALATTPAALLGGGDGPPGPARAGRLAALTPADCLRLIAPGGVGRIAFASASGLIVVPVNYALAAGAVVLATGSGSLIAAHGDGPASFEVDHLDEALGQGWSALIQGQAHRVLQSGEARRLRSSCPVAPWPDIGHDLLIKVVPSRITGRSVSVQCGHAAQGGVPAP